MRGIPARWRTVELGELASIVRGITFAKSDKLRPDAPGAVPCLRTSNVQESLEVDDLVWVPERFVKRDEQWLRPGDTVISMSNSYELVGKVAFNPGQSRPMSFGAFVAVLRPLAIHAKYLYYCIQSPNIQRAVRRGASQTVNIANISAGGLRRVALPVAPQQEQHRIVAAIETHFSHLDAAVASLHRAKANVKRARASVLQAAVEGRLVPTEAELARAEGREYEPASALLARILAERKAVWEASEVRGGYRVPVLPPSEDVQELPEGWIWSSVDQLADGERGLCDGPFGSNLKTEHYVDRGPRVVRLQNIGDGVFRDEHAHISESHFERLRKHEVRGGDLVVASLGDVLPRACVVPEWLGRAVVKADCIRLAPSSRVSVGYLNVVLNSQGVRHRTTERIHGVGRPRLGLGGIREISVPLPPLPEQHRIVAEVDRRLSVLDAVDATIDANLARCARLRQSILQRAFSGQLLATAEAAEGAAATA